MATLSQTKLLPLLARSTQVGLIFLVMLLQFHDCAYYEYSTQEDADALTNYKAENEAKILLDAKKCAKYITDQVDDAAKKADDAAKKADGAVAKKVAGKLDQVDDAAKKDADKCKFMFGNCCAGSGTAEEDSFCAIYCWSGKDAISDHSTADNIWNLYRCFEPLEFDLHQRWVRQTVQRLFSEPLCVNNGGDRPYEYWAMKVGEFAQYIAGRVNPEKAKVPPIWFRIRAKSSIQDAKQALSTTKKLIGSLKDKIDSLTSVGAAPAQVKQFSPAANTNDLIGFLKDSLKEEIEKPCKKASFFRFKVKLSLACYASSEEFEIDCESDSKFKKNGSDLARMYREKYGYGVEKVQSALHKAVCIPEFKKGKPVVISRKKLIEQITAVASSHSI